jgi:beta-phosphoglucomutase
MYKAILFDLDGVVIDSEPLHHKAEDIVLKRHGLKWNLPVEYASTGKPFKDSLFDITKDKNLIAKLLEEKKHIFTECEDEIDIIESTKNFIIQNRKSFKYALVTSSYKEYAFKFLKKFGILEYFEIIITSDDIKNPKPDPEPYLLAVERLKLNKNECVVIEDSILGIQSANAAGIFSVALIGTFPAEKLKSADLVVTEISNDSLGNLLKCK